MNLVLIGVTTVVFLLQVLSGASGDALVERYGMVPARVVDPGAELFVEHTEAVGRNVRGELVGRTVRHEVAPAGVAPWLTLLTCIFLHGGWMHFLGNMWFLWIFGDNVEDCFGKLGYLAFYLAGGVVASATHLVTNLSSAIPTIGASGAVAAVMGAYFVLYPRAKVLTLVPIVFFLQLFVLPATWFLGVWFVMQLFQGTFSLGAVQGAGVAWWAHVGGFAVGYVAARVLAAKHRLRPSVEVLRPRDGLGYRVPMSTWRRGGSQGGRR